MKTIGIWVLLLALLAGITYAADSAVITNNATGSAPTYMTNNPIATFTVLFKKDTSVVEGRDNCTFVNWSISNSTTTTYLQANTTTAAYGFNNTLVSMTWDSSTSLDNLGSAGYTVTAVCRNASTSSGGTVQTATATFGVDNTRPSCSFVTSLSSNSKYLIDQTWTILAGNASSATLQFGSNPVNTMLIQTANDRFAFTGSAATVVEGTYGTVSAVSTDGRNYTTCTALSNIEIDSDSTALQAAAVLGDAESKKGADAQNATNNNNNTLLIIGIVAVALLLIRKKK